MTLDDIRGDLHCHTTLSDGHNTLEEMVGGGAASAAARTWRSPTTPPRTGSATTSSRDALAARIEEVRALDRRTKGIKLLAGTEVNILPDGSLDYDDELLARARLGRRQRPHLVPDRAGRR